MTEKGFLADFRKARGRPERGEAVMVIGIAGGVGSGKSTVLEFLRQEYQVYICMADELGHQAMLPGTPACQQIKELFGKAIETDSGGIDREMLAQIVYGDSESLLRLNEIIHPFVIDEVKRQIRECSSDRLFVLETAILFETGCDKLCDEVWGVLTEKEIRIRRLSKTRGYSRKRAEDIMKKQLGNAELAQVCDRVIVNDGDRDELVGQIRNCMENLLEKKW